MTPFSSVLIVDDEPAVRQLMSRWASAIGMVPQTAGNADEALETLHAHRYDLAIVDVMMPGRDGLWLADEMRREHPGTAVVLATAYTELLDGRAPQPPVADLMLKPFNRQRFLQAVDRGREWHERATAEVEWHGQLLEEVSRRTLAARAHVHQQRALGIAEADAILGLLARQLPDVMAHSTRVSELVSALAGTLEFEDDIVGLATRAALLHDIGKLGIPEALVTSKARLRPGEVAVIRRHADAGSNILANTVSLQLLAPMVRAVNEWFGGGGYPDGLSGADIPLISRLISVADAYDAMTSEDGYRRRDPASAAAELLRCAPKQFDPEVVIPFLVMLGRP